MSEEEIIKVLNNYITDLYHSYKEDVILKAIKGLLELYHKLQKENEKLRDVKNKAIGHINCCKTSLGNYVLSPSEVECLLDILKEGDMI